MIITSRCPFFKQIDLPNLPQDLMDIIQDALRLQHQSRSTKKGKAINHQNNEDNACFLDMEKRLRISIQNHSNFLRALSADQNDSELSFLEQLQSNIASLDSSSEEAYVEDPQKFIDLVSIDVDVKNVHQLLSNKALKYPRLAEYFNEIGGLKLPLQVEENLAGRFVYKTHMTMVHYSQSSQRDMKSHFSRLEGKKVKLTITGILFSNKVAALSVIVPRETEIEPRMNLPPCQNKFSHITVWAGQNILEATANDLPDAVENQMAQRIVFDKHIHVEGCIQMRKRE